LNKLHDWFVLQISLNNSRDKAFREKCSTMARPIKVPRVIAEVTRPSRGRSSWSVRSTNCAHCGVDCFASLAVTSQVFRFQIMALWRTEERLTVPYFFFGM
jgi:hypothetical protein